MGEGPLTDSHRPEPKQCRLGCRVREEEQRRLQQAKFLGARRGFDATAHA